MPNPELQQRQVLIIGAGPSGAIAGALLKRNGHDVLIIERQRFPRFSIGEKPVVALHRLRRRSRHAPGP